MMSASHTPEETKAALHEVVMEMYDKIAGEAPTMTLPVRTKNNIGFDSPRLQVRKKRSIRDATSLGSANCCVLCTRSSSSRK